MEEPKSDIRRMIDCLMHNGPSTSTALSERLGMVPTTVSGNLTYLKGKGIVQPSALTPTRPRLWEVTPSYIEADFGIVRRTVTSWAPHHHRDPLIAALFGPAKEAA